MGGKEGITMKRIVEFIIAVMMIFVMGTTANVSAAEVTEVEINPYTYITVLNAEQLKAVNDINRYYGDAWYNALKKGYDGDGRKVLINTLESFDVGEAWHDSLAQVISNYNK